MDTIFFSCVLLFSTVLCVESQVTAGGCSFEDGPAQCDYQQEPYDDFDWTHVSTQEAAYLSSQLPLGSYMMVDSSQHDPGEKARLLLPVMKKNDTHCIDFTYLLTSTDSSSPGTLNILVKVNKGPLANPIWNVTSTTGRDWLRAELAVSTFWPNEYQVIFEAEVSSGRSGFIAIGNVQTEKRWGWTDGSGSEADRRTLTPGRLSRPLLQGGVIFEVVGVGGAQKAWSCLWLLSRKALGSRPAGIPALLLQCSPPPAGERPPGVTGSSSVG
ncbi:hypothetical protein COCON_G00000350 [Conger conger]|uniref:MAM domain-containing protein n=1 Tax=Conger conger TaxID=82655 RepID=A0A9Q1E0K7_CONCO|nr:hypothetical protein COCON_G00000350 [Conger conger]